MQKYEQLIGKEVKRLDNEIHSQMAKFRSESEDKELTMMQGLIIGFIYKHTERDIFQKDIEAEFSIARSTATGILQLMEKKKYILRESVAEDARLKKLVLTEKGIRLQENTIQYIGQMEERLRIGISEKEMEMFFRILQKMRSNIEGDKNETDRRRDRC